LAEAATRLAERPDGVPDDVWNEAKRNYDEEALAQLVLYSGLVNFISKAPKWRRDGLHASGHDEGFAGVKVSKQ
jgi:predicted heme/steroid binding protein